MVKHIGSVSILSRNVNRLSPEKRTQILTALCEGVSVSATARMVAVSKVTVLKLLADVGPVVLGFQQRTLVNLSCQRVQCDEIWSFIFKKQKRVKLDERGRHWGDVWTWTAICADTKLVPCWHVGTRDAEAARTFMEDLASRLAHRVQLTTDGHTAYLSAVEGAFGWNGIDYAMLEKLYAHPEGSPEAARRYSPSQVVGIEKKWVMGEPDKDHVSTSFAESQNTRMRTNIRRLTRLTNGHSKKLDNHIHAMSLWFMYYNFCRPHETLTKSN
ncbi:MAG TPA: IS1 family transposase, partial [Gemmatimonadaceae bacterium]